jgi:non-specific serine/threonine protein kinase
MKIFISYSRNDSEFAEELIAWLRADKLDVWIDTRQLQPGDEFIEVIRDAIANCDAFIVLVSRDSTGSEWVKLEISIALERKELNPDFKLIPCRLDETPVPDELRHIQYENFAQGLFHVPYKNLFHSLNNHVELSIRPAARWTLKHRRNNLPVYEGRLVGRAHEIESLFQLINSTTKQSTTLLAPGGYGKTRLAVELGNRLLEWFQDGVFFVNLVPLRTQAQMRAAIIRAVSGTSQLGDSLADLLALLADRHMLLILDNFEHLLPCRRLLRTIIKHCSNIRLLITTRIRPPRQASHTWKLNPLSTECIEPELSPAADFFIDIAKRFTVQFHPDREEVRLIEEICREMQGVPFHIGQCASWAGILPIDQLALYLTTSPLNKPRKRRSDHHDSIKASQNWGWSLLKRAQQRLLCTCAMFPGGITLQQIRILLGSNADLPRELAPLVSACWLEFQDQGSSARYVVCNQVTREYVIEQASSRAWIDRCAVDFVGVVANEIALWGPMLIGRNQTVALRHIDVEQDNYFETTRYLELPNCLKPQLDFLRYLYWYCDIVSRYDYLIDYSTAILNFVHHTTTPDSSTGIVALEIAAWAHLSRGLALVRRSSFDNGIADLERAYRLASSLDLKEIMAHAKDCLGIANFKKGKFRKAKKCYQHSLRLFVESNDEFMIGFVKHDLAIVAIQRGKYRFANRLLEEAVQIHLRCEDGFTTAWSLNSLGEILFIQGAYAEAKEAVLRALHLRLKIDHLDGQVMSLEILALIALREEHFDESVDYLRRALTILNRVRSGHRIVDFVICVAAILLRTGNVEDSILFAHWTKKRAKQLDLRLENIFECERAAILGPGSRFWQLRKKPRNVASLYSEHDILSMVEALLNAYTPK